MRLILVTASFLALVAVACAQQAPAPAPQPQPQPRYQADAPPPLPEWFLNIPSEPGVAFYGVGVAGYRSASSASLAQDASRQAAQRQIAETLEVTIQGVTQRYIEQVITPEGDVVEEGLTRTVSRSIVDTTASGIEVVRFATGERDPQTGLFPMFCLCRISFNSVAENLHDEMQRRVQQVRDNAEEAFANLDRLLEQEQERRAGESAGRDAQAEVDSTLADAQE